MIILQNFIEAYHRKSGNSKYDRKLADRTRCRDHTDPVPGERGLNYSNNRSALLKTQHFSNKSMLYGSCQLDSIIHVWWHLWRQIKPENREPDKNFTKLCYKQYLVNGHTWTFYLLTNHHYHLNHYYWCRLNCPSLKGQSGVERFSSQSSLNVHEDHRYNDIIRTNTF